MFQQILRLDHWNITALIGHVTKLEFCDWSCSSDRADLILTLWHPTLSIPVVQCDT
jgi:hypothetical protein